MNDTRECKLSVGLPYISRS